MKDDIFEKFKLNIAILKFEEDIRKENSPKVQENLISELKNKMIMEEKMRKKIVIVFCGVFLLASGVAFATTHIDVIKNYFGFDKGIQSAIQNGYIGKPEMDYIKSETVDINSFNNIPVETKIEEFMMDDVNLNVEFSLKFDEKLDEIFNFKNLYNIILDDLVIIDEENREIFNKKSGYMNYLTNVNFENHSVNLVYNMYNDNEMPKSKKLNFHFGKIKLIEELTNNETILDGDWNINVDVPEVMYNRTSENYKVISCSNKDFNVYTSNVTDTGFEIGVTISNVEKPEYPHKEYEKLAKRFKNGFGYSIQEETGEYDFSVSGKEVEIDEEIRDFIEKDIDYSIKNTPIISFDNHQNMKSYVENSEGKKFEISRKPGRNQNTNFVNDNTYDFYETFTMTKYEATDKIKVVLYYYDEPVIIELKK